MREVVAHSFARFANEWGIAVEKRRFSAA